MLKNYFIIAWRNIQRNKGYTLLNITGLAFGLATFIVALLYFNRENSFDKWDKQLKRVYRIDMAQTYTGGDTFTGIWTPYPLGTDLSANCPEIETVTRVYDKDKGLISANDKQLYVNKLISADSTFFNVFPYKFVYGSVANAMQQPDQAVISLETSRKFFGDMDPVGKTLTLNGGKLYTVSGVFEPTGPSHLDFNICFSSFNKNLNWGAGVYFTYALLKPNTSIEALSAKAKAAMINGLVAGTYARSVSANPKISAPGDNKEQWLKENSNLTINDVFFEPVSTIHLSPKASSYSDAAENHPLLNTQAGNNKPIIFFSIAAIMIVLLACINYTNLSIARAGKRAKEAGMRKVLGAVRFQLMKQFLAESLIQCLIALLLGLILAKVAVYWINTAFHLQLAFFNRLLPTENFVLLGQLVLMVILVSVVSGAYPAFILSSFKPVKVLKGEITKSIKGRLLRNGLVVLQFGISTCFIICMVVIYKQLNYLNSKDPGFSTSHVLVLKPQNNSLLYHESPDQKIDFIKDQLSRVPGVEVVAVTDFYPGAPSLASKNTATANGKELPMTFDYIHFDYFKVLNIKLSAGRDFSRAYSADTVNSAVINETAARNIGYKNPLDKTARILNRDYNIIGVVKDNNVAGYNAVVAPEVYAIGASRGMLGPYRAVLVRVNGRNAATATAAIQNQWKAIEPGFPLTYSWLDESFAKLLERYETLGKMTIMLSVISTIIALMGIFALSAFAAAQRTKEIGIRKVFGASVARITAMLSKEFFKLIVIALLAAFPVAYLITHKWLQEFAFRIDLSWLIFALSGFVILTVALITVSFQAIKAAVVNPMQSLKTE
nr:ABC transporter permease [uncultured Mucilaginibacter sp.]